eukprot:172572_1
MTSWLVPDNPEDYMVYINSIREYTLKKCAESDAFFPIYFISCMHKNLNWTNHCKNQEQLKYFIHIYIEKYYLEHYRPTDIPNLYAMIQYNLSCINLLSLGKPEAIESKMKSESLNYVEKADEYMTIYEKQLKHNQINVYAKFIDRENIRVESAFHGKILCSLARIHLDSFHWIKGLKFINKSCEYFIKQQTMYTAYSGYESIDFVMDLIKCLLIWFDYNKNKSYQIKWKYLLIKAKKTLKYFDKYHRFDRYGRCYIFLGIYYF